MKWNPTKRTMVGWCLLCWLQKNVIFIDFFAVKVDGSGVNPGICKEFSYFPWLSSRHFTYKFLGWRQCNVKQCKIPTEVIGTLKIVLRFVCLLYRRKTKLCFSFSSTVSRTLRTILNQDANSHPRHANATPRAKLRQRRRASAGPRKPIVLRSAK